MGRQSTGLTASRYSVRFDEPHEAGSVDIAINGHRIFSTTPPEASAGRIRISWPAALRPYLRGTATITVTGSASGALLAEGRVSIGRSSRPIEIRDAQGRLLTLNKWQRLGVMISDGDTGLRARLLERTDALVAHLTMLGYTAYITGGTLLGAVRSGDILPHDDDVDLAVLLRSEHPSDLSLDSFALEDRLTALGYTVVRHSSAHLQVTFLHDDGRTDHYIDIFSAFYRGDDFCQPFHVRTPVPRASITPVADMAVAGRDWPAPAVPEDWLVACYGENWAVPDPSFRFVTPLATRRRFENWFGSQNMNRVYWESWYSRIDDDGITRETARLSRALSRMIPAGAPVLDLGCGTGGLASIIAQHGHRVVALDYSYRALALAEHLHGDAVEWRYGNLYDRRRTIELIAELVRDGGAWHVTVGHLLEGLTDEGRGNTFLALRQLLRGGGSALASFDTDFVTRRFRGDDPQTWHLPLEWARREAAVWGIDVAPLETYHRATPRGRRHSTVAVLKPMEA